MWNMFCVTLALMAGTAGLPHVIVRFYTVKNVKAARWSAFWALLFIGMLYLTAPATAAFARYYMIDSINGKTQEELPQWFENWEKTGLILWIDDGDGKLRYSAGADNEVFNKGGLTGPAAALGWDKLIASRDGERKTTLQLLNAQPKIRGPDKDIIVLATPEMANLYAWIIALVAAGGLAAALSTASGLLLVVSSSIAHDLSLIHI